ncbi:MAG: NAD+ synthase [Dehalococcoidales bacterium]|nr:NAD+ synthase [Dehalococcoidales bacterium]
MHRLRVAIAQINATVGDFDGNLKKIIKAIEQARSLGADLVTFPELALCGYPPEDLILKPQFVGDNRKYLERVVTASSGLSVIVGFIDAGDGPYNAAAIIHDGKLADIYHKICLPNYGVFDENRYFHPGKGCPVYVIAGVGVGVSICEDIWHEDGPVSAQAHFGAGVIVNISASPYHYGKAEYRKKTLARRARDNRVIIVYNNLVGGQDELVFDGNSLVLDEKGRLLAQGWQFAEDLVLVDLDVEPVATTGRNTTTGDQEQWPTTGVVVSESPSSKPKPTLPRRQPYGSYELAAEIYHALVLGTGDYVRKNGFGKVVVGLSGGVDSSLVATIAVDALGAENVVAVAMPSRYSSPGSLSDAGLLAQNLGISLMNIPIERVFRAYLDSLAEPFSGTESGTAEENIQARIRGNLLMALSNKFGWLVLATGNKSEMATGYTTLYGDMAGGFAVIKDVPKTMVYKLARYRNSVADTELIPPSVLAKTPSAELGPDQKDTDTLPPYELLDSVLTAYVEEDKSVEQIIRQGVAPEVVRKVARLVDASEYKRRQAPPGVKITTKAFGRDRRLPITNKFRG